MERIKAGDIVEVPGSQAGDGWQGTVISIDTVMARVQSRSGRHYDVLVSCLTLVTMGREHQERYEKEIRRQRNV